MNPLTNEEDASAGHDRPGLKSRIGILGVGLLGNYVIVYAFDYVLYPFVIWRFGLGMGCVVMTILSFLVCYATILFYDWSKQDWLGIETLKEFRDYQATTKSRRIAAWFLRRSDPIVLLFLSIKFDPFITTAYMRHGSYRYNGLTQRDWRIFMTSLFIANIYWSFVAFTGVSIVTWAWDRLT